MRDSVVKARFARERHSSDEADRIEVNISFAWASYVPTCVLSLPLWFSLSVSAAA